MISPLQVLEWKDFYSICYFLVHLMLSPDVPLDFNFKRFKADIMNPPTYATPDATLSGWHVTAIEWQGILFINIFSLRYC